MRFKPATFPILITLFLATIANAQPAKYSKISASLNQSALQSDGEAIVAVVLDIDAGYHAQSSAPLDPNLIPLKVSPDDTAAIVWSEPRYPAAVVETYPLLGKVSVYSGRVIVYLPVKVKPQTPAGPVTLAGTIRFQICDDAQCFFPQIVKWSIDTQVAASGDQIDPRNIELFEQFEGASLQNPGASLLVESDQPAWGVLRAFGAAFLAGIIFNIVPCVLPVLPIKVLGFAEVAQHHRAKTFLLAVIFGLGIVTVFAALAMLMFVLDKTLLGGEFSWGQQFSNPYFAWGIVILFAILAAWLFGLLNVALPTTVYNLAPRHDTYFGNYLWGIMTAILSTPCTGPLFPPLLLWAQSHPAGIAVSAVTMVGVGMAFPYLVLSLFPEVARKFPRVGPWAELFKQMLGFLMLASAVFFAAGRFVGGAGPWWWVAAAMGIGAVYLMYRTIRITPSRRAIGIASVIALLFVAVPAYTATRFIPIVAWIPYSDQALSDARRDGKIVLIKFTANWCLNCHYIEATVFHDRDALAALRKYEVVTIKADLTADDAPGWKPLQKLSTTGGIPLTAIYVPGRENPVLISSVYTTATLVQVLGDAKPTPATN